MSNSVNDQTLEKIWQGDLFDRQAEAQLMIGYIESIAKRKVFREDTRSYTIAIDAPYGEGKTFFLRRLAENLTMNHPVAFIDAWADDLANEPLTALAATLKKALEPLIKQSETASKWESVANKTGKVAKIIATGLFKKGLGLIITTSGAEALADVVGAESEKEIEAIEGDIKGTGKTVVDSVSGAFENTSSKDFMVERIEMFEAGQTAVKEMKKSLEDLVKSLSGTDLHAPIVIFIDELDRCRPTYAVKLLEEIKHMFDVPGLVFVFGMNGEQLGHSLSGAYGANFDGAGYLRRFINRRYRLSTPDLTRLIETQLQQIGIDLNRFQFPQVQTGQDDVHNPEIAHIIAKYMKAYGLAARDVFQVIDMLQTCTALTGNNKLLLGYLLPLILSRILGNDTGIMKEPKDKMTDWVLVFPSHSGGANQKMDIWQLVLQIEAFTKISLQDLSSHYNKNNDVALSLVVNARHSINDGNRLADPSNYGELLETVGRFSNPQIPVSREDE